MQGFFQDITVNAPIARHTSLTDIRTFLCYTPAVTSQTGRITFYLPSYGRGVNFYLPDRLRIFALGSVDDTWQYKVNWSSGRQRLPLYFLYCWWPLFSSFSTLRSWSVAEKERRVDIAILSWIYTKCFVTFLLCTLLSIEILWKAMCKDDRGLY